MSSETPYVRDPYAHRLVVIAAAIAALAAAAIAFTGWMAYRAARNGLENATYRTNLVLAELMARESVLESRDASMLERIELHWSELPKPYPESFYCIIGPDGTLLDHSTAPFMKGTFVGENRLPEGGIGPTGTVGELLRTHQSWSGRNVSARGQHQLAAYAYSQALNGLVAVHAPLEVLDRDVGARLRPVVVGYAVAGGVVGPLALAIMYFAVVSTRRRLDAANASLEMSEEQLRIKELAMEASVTGMCLVATDGTITYANPAMVRMWGGQSKDELLGHHLGELARDPDRVVAIFDEARRHGSWAGPGMARRKDGRLVNIDITCTAIAGGHDAPLAFLGTFIDTTESHEEHRRATRLARILDATTDIVGMASADGSGFFLNKAGRQRLGLSESDDVTATTPADFHPAEDEHFLKEVAMAVAARDGVWSGEARFRSRDGTVFPVSQILLCHRDSQGRAEYFSTIARDISEQRAAAERLRESERLYGAVFNSVSDAIFVIAQDGITVDVNEAACRMHGCERDYLVGRTPEHVIPAESVPTFRRFVEEVSTGHMFRMDGGALRSDGVIVPVEVTGIPFQYRGEPHMLAVLHDISDRLQAEAELARREKEFRLLAEHSPDVIAQYNSDHVTTYISPSVETASGFKPAALIGKRITESGYPEDVARVWDEVLRDIFANPRPLRHEFEIDGAGGRRAFESRLEPARAGDGTVESVLVVSRDITDLKAAAREAREARDRLSLALEVARAGAWEWNVATGGTTWSNEQYRLMGLEPGSIKPSSANWLASIHSDDREAVRKLVRDAVRSGVRFETEYRVVRPSGEVKWAIDIGQPIRATDGTIERWIGYQADVTERKAAEQALSESEMRFRALFHHSAEGIYLHEFDGRLVEVNEKTVELFGRSREELLDRTVMSLSTADTERIWQEAFEALETKGEALVRVPLAGRRGQLFIGEVSAVVIEVGGRRLVQGILRDITERTRAERALRESEGRFRALATHAPVGIFECNARGAPVYVNQRWSELAGLSLPEVLARGWSATVHPDDAGEVRRAWIAALEAGETFDMDFRFAAEGARVHWVNCLAVPMLDEESSAIGYLGTVLDVSERRESEEHAHRSAAFRDALIESATEGICVCEEVTVDPGVRFSIWNARMREITGYSVEEINRFGWHQTVYRDAATQARAAERMERMRRGESLEVEEWCITRKDGVRRDLLISTRVILGYSTTPQVLAMMHDITDRKRFEAALRGSEERYRRIVQTAAEGIWAIDAVGRTDYVNPRMTAILGYTESEMVGRSFFEFMDAEARAFAEANLDRRSRGLAEEFEFRYLHKNGTHVWTRVSATPLADENGVFLGSLAMITDITDLRRAEHEAERNRVLLKAAIEASPAGIIVAEAPDARIVMANSAALGLRGERQDEVRDFDALKHAIQWRMLHADGTPYSPEELPLFRAIQNGETVRDEDVIIQHKDGEIRWVLGYAAPVRDSGGKVIAGVVVFPDITDRKVAEQKIRELNTTLERRVRERTFELEAANRELEGFSYSVSHDLRAPLRGIDGWSMALLEDFGPALDAQARTYLERVRSESQRMGRLIDDLLRLARLSRSPLEQVPVDLSALVAVVVERHRMRAPERVVDVTVEPDMSVRADPRLLEAALDNLIGNAFKFTGAKENPAVNIGVLASEGGTRYFVRDNGAGFDMRYRDKLFRPFQRLHHESEFSGSGIGLATVQRIIHRHGGVVGADSVLGEGSTFYFTLP